MTGRSDLPHEADNTGWLRELCFDGGSGPRWMLLLEELQAETAGALAGESVTFSVAVDGGAPTRFGVTRSGVVVWPLSGEGAPDVRIEGSRSQVERFLLGECELLDSVASGVVGIRSGVPLHPIASLWRVVSERVRNGLAAVACIGRRLLQPFSDRGAEVGALASCLAPVLVATLSVLGPSATAAPAQPAGADAAVASARGLEALNPALAAARRADDRSPGATEDNAAPDAGRGVGAAPGEVTRSVGLRTPRPTGEASDRFWLNARCDGTVRAAVCAAAAAAPAPPPEAPRVTPEVPTP